MTDRLRSCKDSPDGRHEMNPISRICVHCHRTVGYLTDLGWNAPALDPDAHMGATESGWQDEEADTNDWGV